MRKNYLFYAIAANLLIVGLLLTYFQLFGNKIIVEPPKVRVPVPRQDIDVGVVIDGSMLCWVDIDQRDYVGGIKDPKEIIGYKPLVKLKKNMQLFPHFLQPPAEQHKPGYFKAAIDLEGVGGTAANQVRPGDYINLMLVLTRDNHSGKAVNVAEVVLAKRKVLQLVNSAGVSKGKSEKNEFKAQYVVLEMNMGDYTRYKWAQYKANSQNGKLEAVICDPTQPPIKEIFSPGTLEMPPQEVGAVNASPAPGAGQRYQSKR